MIGRFIAGFWHWLKPLDNEPVDGEGPLGRYLDHHAAFVTQRTIAGYVQMKTRVHLHELLKETMFREAYERSRWTSYAAVLSDLAIITEGYLRDHRAEDAADAVAKGLARVHGQVLSGQTPPPDLKLDWEAVQAAFEARLARSRLAPPQAVGDVARTSGAALFECLPIHKDLRELDERSFVDGVRFIVVSVTEPLRRLLRHEALAADLARLGATLTPPPSLEASGPAISARR
jgi:hypothetical protein